jgi:hypothetical protein
VTTLLIEADDERDEILRPRPCRRTLRTSKVDAVADARGRPVDLRLTGSRVTAFVPAAELPAGKFGAAIIADRGYDSDRVVSLVEAQGGRAVIPPRSLESGRREFDRELYREVRFGLEAPTTREPFSLPPATPGPSQVSSRRLAMKVARVPL